MISVVAMPSAAAELYGHMGLETVYTSNVYLNRGEEHDLILEPSWGLGVDFGEFWSAGYDGSLEGYVFNPDLLFHEHELFLLANPAFGKEGEHELTAEVGVDTQRNTDTYATVNLLRPFLFFELVLEPRPWVRWSLSEHLSFRWFYDETANDSLDSWTRMSLMFTAQTRTTVTPRVAFGNRYYPHPGATGTNDRSDQQLEAGIHASQGLWAGAGLQLDYAYLYALGDSLLVLRQMTSEEFNYIGEEFLYTGHIALLGFKQVFEAGTSLGVTATFRYKRFGGWIALGSLGEPLADGAMRTDRQLEPEVWLKHTFWPKEDASRAVPAVSLGLSYTYLRQWSNDYWFDTQRHLVVATLELSW